MKTQPKPSLSLSIEPVLLVMPTTGECPRCKGASKVPNLEPGYHLVDCPTCEGTGRVEVYAPLTEEDLDESVALGMELSELRRAKEAALQAAETMQREIQAARVLIEGTPHIQAEAALPILDRALDTIQELLSALGDGGAR